MQNISRRFTAFSSRLSDRYCRQVFSGTDRTSRVGCGGGHNTACGSSGRGGQRNHIEGKPEYWSQCNRGRALEDDTMADTESIPRNITNAVHFNGTGELNPAMESATSFIIAAGFILFTSFIGILGNTLVFCVNPFIYFLVGRQKMQGVWNFLEKGLKKVFREEEDEEGRGKEEATKGIDEGDTTESNSS
ncbi:hypothetical protein NDU88_007146 [Pleurodeles waltl]|uniref:Uncharacterized protein n=1 Tax=Pleurodeles waltl TaxID=8319 RepID=A0AAV7SRZ4_PLEWA|nr:hypothetical protein NDU88_007146 [Pleurodeles waltl]